MPRHDLIDTAAQAFVSLRRDPHGARLGGVCQGLATRTGVDVRLLRVAAVVLALSGGVGAALYAGGWLLTPTVERSDVPLARVLPPAQNWDAHTRLAITAVITAAVWLLVGSWTPFGLTPALVIGAVLLLNHRRRGRRAGEAPVAAIEADPGSATFTSAVSAWQQRLDDVAASGTPGETPWTPPAADAVPPPIARTTPLDAGMRVPAEPVPAAVLPEGSRTRRRLVPVLVLASALLGGLVTAYLPLGLDSRHRVMVALAASLGVLGLGLVAAGLAGFRARSAVPFGVGLCVALALLQSGLVNSHLTWTPSQGGTGTAQSPMTYSGTQGRVTISPADAGRTIHLDARASDVTVTVPGTMAAVVEYSIRYSDLTVADRRIAGFGRDSLTLAPSATASLPTDPGASVTLVVTATMSRVVILHD